MGLTTQSLIDKAHAENASLLNVQVGVFNVDFKDGSSWSANLPSGNTFMPSVVQKEGTKCSGGALLPAALLSTCTPPQKQASLKLTDMSLNASAPSPNIYPGCFFRCQGTDIAEYCESHFSSCTLHACGSGGCPYQTCTSLEF